MAAKIFKSSVNVKSAGSPMKAVAKLDLKDGEEALFATIYGIANGVVKRADPKDPEKFYSGLKGTFEVLPGGWCDVPLAIGGSTLFAPDGIHEMVVAQLDKGVRTVSFAFEAYVVAGGTAGFTWKYRFVDQAAPEEEDILASVRGLIVKEAAAPALPAPEHKAAKAK